MFGHIQALISMSCKGNKIFIFLYCSYPFLVPTKAVKCLNFCFFSKTCLVNASCVVNAFPH